MRRWNGWGDDRVHAHLPETAQAMLAELVGAGTAQGAIKLENVVAQIPKSRLPEHHLISLDPEDRLRHSRGQSLPDWVAWRSGEIGAYPDGVAFPTTTGQLREVLKFAAQQGASVIPYGGGTSVAGHLTVPRSERPVLTLSLARLNTLIELDEKSRLATFGAGVAGPDLEAALRARGYTLGHYPQSFEYATLGGWIATRSSGQQSLGYGRIEDLYAGGLVISPAGDLQLPPLPASSAGPDLRQIVLGSEGRMGVIAEGVVRVSPIPAAESFHAVFFPDWNHAEAAVRHLSQSGIPLSMMRLSNEMETETNLTLSGKPRVVNYLKRYLSIRGVKENRCMLLFGVTGRESLVKYAKGKTIELCRAHKGVYLFSPLGKAWNKNRFRAPYLRNSLWDSGYAADTLETCVTWDQATPAMRAIEKSLGEVLGDQGERTHVFTHLSHFYPSGCSIYTTYLFRLGKTPRETLARWSMLKDAASRQIVAHRGTISHQHGVGTDHAPYLEAEKSPLGMETIRTMCRQFDPEGVMNPGGKLVR